MQIKIFYSNGSVAEDRARDMHNAEPRAREWASLSGVSRVEIRHQQQILFTFQGKD